MSRTEVGLTKEQEKVRDIRNKNMLVSAAAGSGKTFVLVERIISMILDSENPVDVDRILVVTFTTAAASEMKDRIRRAIDKALETHGTDSRIRTQATLIHGAHIRTIDSFCSWVVKNYFYEIDQDPSFRIATSGELKMLQDEVLSELISDRLKTADKDFMLLADSYISGRNVSSLMNLVFELHKKAVSFPWVDEWYDDSLKLYQVSSVDELVNAPFMKELILYKNRIMESLIKRVEMLTAMYPADSDSKDKTIFLTELNLLKSILDAETYTDTRAILSGAVFARFSSAKTPLNPDELEYAKSIRKLYKDECANLLKKYFRYDMDELFDTLCFVKRQATSLIDLAREYSARLLETKKKRNIFDFNDIEHMALEILRDKDTAEHPVRPVAIELASHFREVMVDEYQDSNELQEQILTAVCSGNNYFTVGDVKQSIYAFRQASPQLFIDKLYTYPTSEDGVSIRVDLDKNFRSRNTVLEFCNNVFRPLMQEDMGGVIYDAAAELKEGDDTFLGDSNDYRGEILIAEEDKDAMAEMDIQSADELEAKMVAIQINKMIKDGFLISAKDENKKWTLKPATYRDIVILMRATSNYADTYISVLKENGIPAYVAEEKGFFDREEIDTVLSMLTVIDNPNNDIPLATVLHSPMFDFSSERLAQIRTFDTENNLYGCLLNYHENNPDAEDVNRFFDRLNGFRDKALDTTIHEMISIVLKETGYGLYVSALPQGHAAVANLNKLIDEAISFESTSYKGLSRFVNYIQGLRTYDEDLGLAKTVGENDNAVRIMTIHKSKGLEFPVVFLCGCGKKLMSDRDNFAYDSELGFALNYKNPITRVQSSTPFCSVIKDKNNAASRGEYLRILYVALTRPVDKIFITATMEPTKDKTVAELIGDMNGEKPTLSFLTKSKAKTSLELILRSLYSSEYNVRKHIITCGDLFVEQVEKTIVREEAKARLLDMADTVNENAGDIIKANFSAGSTIQKSVNYKSKYSVSEIKHQAMEKTFAVDEDAAPAFIYTEDEPYIPSFIRDSISRENEQSDESNIPAGALYGTAMHRFMECYDFSRDDYSTSFKEQLDYMKAIHALSDDEFSRINYRKLGKFLSSDLAGRMHIAAANNTLYKEKPFVFGSTPKDLFEGDSEDSSDESEMILVQGIIDVFFEEEDGIVLLDYKTDRVDDGNELVLRYEKQLQLYKDAIEKSYNTRVKETLIYSFYLDETLSLNSYCKDSNK